MSRELVLLLALPLAAIALALAGNLAIASFRSPVSIPLSIFALIIPVGSLVIVPIPLPSPFNTPSSAVGALAIGALVVHLIGERRAGATASPPWIPEEVAWWLLFAGFASLTFLWSVNPDETLQELLILLSLVALYALAAFARVSPLDLRRFELAIVLGGVIAAAYGIMLLITSDLPLFGGTVPRLATVGGMIEEAGPNETAATLLLPLAIATGRSVDPDTRGRRALWVMASALIAIAIVLTASRGGLLSMGVVVVVVAWNAGRMRMVVWLGILAVGALLIVPTFGADALQARLFKDSSSGRTLIWRTAFEACDRHCLTGSGYGTFPDVYNEALGVSANISGQKLRQRAHNIWVRAGIETGLVGLVLMSGALFLHARDLNRLPRLLRGPPLAGFLGVITANVFLSNIGFKYFWLTMIHGLLTIVVWTRASAPVPALVDVSVARKGATRSGLGVPS